MANQALAYQFTWGCKFVGKCGIYHLWPWFNLTAHFFCTIFALNKCGENQIFVQWWGRSLIPYPVSRIPLIFLESRTVFWSNAGSGEHASRPRGDPLLHKPCTTYHLEKLLQFLIFTAQSVSQTIAELVKSATKKMF